MRLLKFLKSQAEWLFCGFTLITLCLFLLGHDLFGYSGLISTGLALIGTIIAAIASFLFATLIVPIIALITGAITALIAAVTGLLGLLIGGIFTPLAALFTGWVTAIFTWISGTWLGTLLMPLYNVIGPLVIKIAPWITVSKSAGRALSFAERYPRTRKFVRYLAFWRKPRRSLTVANQSATRGRSSSPAKRQNVQPRRSR